MWYFARGTYVPGYKAWKCPIYYIQVLDLGEPETSSKPLSCQATFLDSRATVTFVGKKP